MKVIVWGINYSPELVGISVYNTEMCEYLQSAGHQVTMVTGFPYYPLWRKHKRDAYCLYRQENIEGVNVWRCWQYVPSSPTVLKRMIHEASFVVTSTLKLLTLPRADVYIAVGPPMLLGVFGGLLCKLMKAPVVYHIQDLQPDAAHGLGMLKHGLMVGVLYKLQRFAFKTCAKISSISPRMCDKIAGNGAPKGKLIFFPNWVKIPDQHDLPPIGTWKHLRGLSPEVPIVSYAGNLGAKQGLELLINAAKALQDVHPVLFVVAGNGGNEVIFKRACADEGVTNILFFDVLPAEEHTALLVDSEFCVIPQKAGSSVSFLPSKLLKILALARPVVTNADPGSPLHDAVTEGNFGISATPGDAAALRQAIVELLADEKRRATFGAAGRKYVERFDRKLVLSTFESELLKIVSAEKTGQEMASL